MTSEIRYGKYTITYWRKPIPTDAYDWDWVHDDYDGAPDSRDHRCGSARTISACKDEIDELEDELQESGR